MPKILPYLAVSNAMEALDLYKKIFGAKVIERLPVTEDQAKDMGVPDGADLSKTTMHSAFKIGRTNLYMSDSFSSAKTKQPNISLMLQPDSLKQMQRYYGNAKEHGCTITQELTKMFWGDHYCAFTDPFGIRWMMSFAPKE